jgi:hypothetical protein
MTEKISELIDIQKRIQDALGFPDILIEIFHSVPQHSVTQDRLCVPVVRVSGYRSRGPELDSQPYQIF